MRSQRLLLIPGILCDARLWSEQVESLADCFGIAVAELRRGESISEMAEAVLGQAPRRFSLAGFSLGGQVALEIARVAGERIERLALLSTTCAGVLPDVRAAIENAISTIERGCFEQYLQHAYLGYVHPRRARDGVLRRTFLEMARAVGPQGAVRQMRASLSIRKPFPHLSRIACPAAIIAGEQDRYTSPAAQLELALSIRGSVLTMISDSGHFTPMEQPDAVTNALEAWLAA
ncbi:MAG TPA: alpha/beta hydrolase [Bryobacteraceae bacterium]|nr:alpha/beta hydrolase [Bryobacteraceae bacterium]